ncbi:MAG: hypothetical protein NT031_02400 [Planctomycetota bacterium]|nr:hypothetical protein [Planctomycetota bacterium]
MKRFGWQVLLGLALVALSGGLYALQYWHFRRGEDELFYLMQDVAFVPVQVLLVTLVIHRMLEWRSKQNMLSKLNMVVGAFFSEVGTNLMKMLSASDAGVESAREKMHVSTEWSVRQFKAAAREWAWRPHQMAARSEQLKALDEFLRARVDFLLRLLENPNLLEHDSFTDLLWAVFHLSEELRCRPGFDALPVSDLAHLSGDMKRAYGLLVVEWLVYLRHLKRDYPYLFSLAVRTNPFNTQASPVVQA